MSQQRLGANERDTQNRVDLIHGFASWCQEDSVDLARRVILSLALAVSLSRWAWSRQPSAVYSSIETSPRVRARSRLSPSDHTPGDKVAFVDVASQVRLVGIPCRERRMVVAVGADPIVHERASGRPGGV
jgi:hypothetical protein